MKTQHCSRCGNSLSRPLEANSNYVRASDFSEDKEVEVAYAMLHTDKTLSRLDEVDAKITDRDRQAIAAEMAHPDAPRTIEVGVGTERVETEGGATVTTKLEEVEFSIPTSQFEHVKIDDPNIVQDDDNVALTYTKTETKEIEKTGTVCPDCTKPEDTILWGTDK